MFDAFGDNGVWAFGQISTYLAFHGVKRGEQKAKREPNESENMSTHTFGCMGSVDGWTGFRMDV